MITLSCSVLDTWPISDAYVYKTNCVAFFSRLKEERTTLAWGTRYNMWLTAENSALSISEHTFRTEIRHADSEASVGCCRSFRALTRNIIEYWTEEPSNQ